MRRRANNSSTHNNRKKKGRSSTAVGAASLSRKKALKKRQQQQPTIQELLYEAATAETAMDAEAAHTLYSQAYSQLVLLKPPPLLDRNDGVDHRSDANNDQLIIHILQKMGELQVSLNDPDTAKVHFVDAIQRLEATKPELTPSSTSMSSSDLMTYYETHSNLCFYIGQSSLEHEGLDAYIKGIASLEKCIDIEEKDQKRTPQQCDNKDEDDDDKMESDEDEQAPTKRQHRQILLEELKEKLSGAYCNIAELYLTDLCEEDNAESECERYLERALQIVSSDGTGPYVDALQTMASLRLSQQRPVDRQLEAVPFILQAYEKQRVGSEALAALVGLSDKQSQSSKDGKATMVDDDDENEHARELLEVDAANDLPEFEFRCQTAKLLLECAALLKAKRQNQVDAIAGSPGNGVELANEYFRQECKCISAAVSVLGSLLAQNDEIIEIWYLTGCAFAAKTPPSADAASYYLERAKEMLTKIRESLQQDLQYAGDSEKEELQDELELNATQMQDVQNKLDEIQTVVMDTPMEQE